MQRRAGADFPTVIEGCASAADPRPSGSPRVGLVLGAGGTVGVAYHCGVLAALGWDLGWDARQADLVVGTSAGSVVGALLRLGVSAADLAAWTAGAEPGVDHRELLAALSTLQEGLPPLRTRALARVPAMPPMAMWRSALDGPGALARAALAAMLPAGRVDMTSLVTGIKALDGVALPPGLRLCATRRDTGRRVVFGGRRPVPPPPLGLAVAASCAIPAFLAPVCWGGREYVDGGLRSTTNADVCVGDGLDVVIVVAPMSAARGSAGVGSPLRWMVHRRLDAETRALAAVGTTVVRIEPSPQAQRVMGVNMMEPERAGDVLRAAFVETGRQVARAGLGHLLGRHPGAMLEAG